MNKENNGLVVLIVILFITVIALCGVIVYMQIDKNNNEIANSQNTQTNNQQENSVVNDNVENNTNDVSKENEDNTEEEKDKEEVKEDEPKQEEIVTKPVENEKQEDVKQPSNTENSDEKQNNSTEETNKDNTVENVVDIIDKSNELINASREELKNVISDMQKQVLSYYNNKVLMGTEVMAACYSYEESKTVSVMVLTRRGDILRFGKYAFDVNKEDYENGVTGELYATNVTYPILTDSTRSTKDELGQAVSKTSSYFSYLVKDKTTDSVMGILFVQK